MQTGRQGSHQAESSAADWAVAVRRQLPAVNNFVYLNAGTAGPLPTVTTEAVRAAVVAEGTEGRGDLSRIGPHIEQRGRCRSLVARTIGSSLSEVALTHHSSDAINVVLWGTPWRSGDEIVTTALEHDAVAVPIGVIASRHHLSCRFVDVGLGDDPSALVDAIGPRTRLVVISHVAYGTGAELPVGAVVEQAHRFGAAVLLDGAQSVGAMPVDVRALGVDYLTVSGQKWLCGPEGTGALYVAEERLALLQPTFCSYFSAHQHDFRGAVTLHEDARRYEVGMMNRPVVAGFAASLAWLLDDVGVERAAVRARALVAELRARLEATEGVVLITPAGGRGLLVSFDLPAFSPARLRALARALSEDHRIVLRSIDHPPYALRASIGFFNDEHDLDALVGALSEALRRGPEVLEPRAGPGALPDHR